MSNTNQLIPKEKQSAFERYELASLGDAPGAVPRSVEESNRLREKARADGYEAGLAEGRQAALEEGRKASQQAVARLADLAQAFELQLHATQATVAEHVLALAMDVAKAVLKTQLHVQPETGLDLVREMLQQLPAGPGATTVRVHPEDARLIHDHLGEQISAAGWRVVADASVSCGGCLLDSDTAHVDATIETRWRRVAQALGTNSAWPE